MTCKACTHYKGKVSLPKKDAAGKPRRHWVMVCHMIGYVEILSAQHTPRPWGGQIKTQEGIMAKVTAIKQK